MKCVTNISNMLLQQEIMARGKVLTTHFRTGE